MTFIHPLAVVDETVQIGEGSKVWQFASLTRGVILGRDCSVSPHAMLDGSIYGNRVLISAGVACGPGFKVGNDVFLGPNSCLANDMWPLAVKDGYDEAALRSNERFAVIIEDNVTIGAGAVVLPGVRICEGAVVAAGAVVDRDVPDACLWRREGLITSLPANLTTKRMRWAC